MERKPAEQVRGSCLLSFLMAIFSHTVVSIAFFYFSYFFLFFFLICTATAAAIFTFHFYWQPQANAVKYLAKKETARLPKGFYVSGLAFF